MRAFSNQLSITSWEKNFKTCARLTEPRSEYNIFFQNNWAAFASSPFSYRGKSHSVSLRGVDPKIHRKRPKKERLKNWFVSTKMLEAWLLVTCCNQGHATAPTHALQAAWAVRACEGRAVWFPEHQTVSRRCVSPRFGKSDF